MPNSRFINKLKSSSHLLRHTWKGIVSGVSPSLSSSPPSPPEPSSNTIESPTTVEEAPASGSVEPENSSSPSVSHTPPPTIFVDPPVGCIADVASAGFEGLKTTLRLAERASGILPPLQLALAALVGVIDIMEQTVQNRQDRTDLERKLAMVVSIINEHRHESDSTLFARRLEGLSTAIKYQMAIIQRQQDHGVVRHVADGAKDANEIAATYRTLSYLLDAFQMDTALAIEETTQDLLSHALLEKLPRAPYASYNASSAAQRHACTEGTREAILAGLMEWATDSVDTKIYWLNGMAGTGKTTIAYTLSDILDKNLMLGTTFFCSRVEDDCRNVNHIFRTIAYGLARRFPSVLDALVNVLKSDPDAGYRSMQRQFSDLIVTPVKAACKDLAKRPVVIIIDALDECVDQAAVANMLLIISKHSQYLPLKFFITSRPEQVIRNSFNRRDFEHHTKFLLHDVEKHIVSADIEIYARERLVEIGVGRSDLEGSLDDWPPEHDFKILVRRAANLFIYASTACEYIAGGGGIRERLAVVTRISARTFNGKTDTLDALYGTILNHAYEAADAEEQKVIRQVLRAMICARNPLSMNSLGILLGVTREGVRAALSSLHSVIHISSSRDWNVPITVFHASFPDYLTDPGRSGENFLDTSQTHQFLAIQCLVLMRQHFRENICCLDGRPPNAEIPLSTVKQYIPAILAYACTYWVSHVTETMVEDVTGNVYNALRQFFHSNVLHWFECLSLLGRLDIAVDSLQRLESWSMAHSDVAIAIRDARRFVTENYELVKYHCLETYHFALIWLPTQSCIRKQCEMENESTVKIVLGLRETWGACETVMGHSDNVVFVAFSTNGSRIASVSLKKISIWNVATGELEAVLEQVTNGPVIFSPDNNCVLFPVHEAVRIWNVVTGESEVIFGRQDFGRFTAFSPDSSCLAFISTEGTISIWNVATRELKTRLVEHSSSVNKALFSPDGNRIAAICGNATVRIWNVTTGKLEAALEHSHNVMCATFSPNGSRVASVSADQKFRIWDIATDGLEITLDGRIWTNSVAFSPDGSLVLYPSNDLIYIWNAVTGQMEGILKGHSHDVRHAIFSPDGSCIASASTDQTVRIWNGVSFKSETALQGHSDTVNSMAFSPDGSHVVSASKDGTIFIWNAVTGQPVAALEGQNAPAVKVTFSHDGGRVIAALTNNTVRIWNAETGTLDIGIEGHAYDINAVIMSPDNSRVATASDDTTVRIWSSATGRLEARLEGHCGGVQCVMFSPDGNRIVSADDNEIIRVWNATTGGVEAILDRHSDGTNSVIFLADGVCAADIQDDSQSLNDLSSPRSLSSISKDREWVFSAKSQQSCCWIPPLYRDFLSAEYHESKICLGYKSGLVLILNL